MSKIGDLFVRLGLKKDGFDKGIKEATNTTKSFGSSATKALSGVAAKFLSVAAAIKVIGDSVKTMASFQRANSTLASVLKTTTAGIQELTQSAKDLGRTTEFTASDVTRLQTELARLGFQQADILNMQKSVLKFASAVGTDLASAAAFAGGSLRSFGLTSEDTNDLLDIMADATAKSALNFSKLETAMGIVFPVAKQFGLSVADTTAMLGTLSNVMPDVSSAATAMRNILMNLADDNGKLATAIGHSAKTFPEIVDAFEELTKKGVDLNEVLGMSDKRSAAALSAFINNTEALRNLRNAFNDSTGAVDEMYDTMTNNLTGAVRNLKSAWEGFVLSLSQSTGPLKSVVDWLTKMVNLVTDLNEATQTGGKGPKDKKEENELWERFKYIGDHSGKEEMQRQFDQWQRDAQAAYDRAIDNYNAHRSRKNKKAMMEAGSYVMNLADIAGKVRNYNPNSSHTNNALQGSTPTGSGGGHELSDEEKDQIKRDRQRIEHIKQNSLEENEALAAKYEANLALLKKYGEDSTALSEQFTRDLVANLTIDAKPDDMLEGIMDAPERLQKHYDEILAIMQKYNLDTSSLQDKFNLLMIQATTEQEAEYKEQEDALDEWVNAYIESYAELNGLSLDPAILELRKFGDQAEHAMEQQMARLEQAKEMTKMFQQAVVAGFSDACEEMAMQLFGLKEANTGEVVKAMLEPLADMAMKAGEIIMAEGIATMAANSAMMSFGATGVGAVAAGAALMAAGAAAKAGLAALATSGTSAAVPAGYSGDTTTNSFNSSTEITVYVEGKIKGSDIVLSGSRTQSNWAR